MPSSVVHVAAAALLAALFLEEAFSTRAVLVVCGAAVVPDLDAFVGLVIPNAHRAALHNIFVPLLLGLAVVVDVRVRKHSFLRSHFGPHAPRVAAIAVIALAVAGSGLDFVTNGINLFYPLHDQFYTFSGKIEFSSTRGFVQTFIQPTHGPVSTTGNTHYSTVVNPTPPGSNAKHVKRVAYVVSSGWQLWLALFGYGALAARFVEARSP